GEIVLAENSRLQTKIYELQQRIIALNADRDELIQENICLKSKNEELVTERNQFETDNIQIHIANENLTRLNDMLKIVLRDCEDEKDHYKATNLKEFEEFISNYIFSLFNNIGILF
ncbi:18732_t:CDS:1, partial [Racocetra persica]